MKRDGIWLSHQTVISMAQYLALQSHQVLIVLFEKYSLDASGLWEALQSNTDRALGIKDSLQDAASGEIEELLMEIARTRRDLRSHINPVYRYDERWADLRGFLELDGIIIQDGELVRVAVEPQPIRNLRDALSEELDGIGTPVATDVSNLIKVAASDFAAERFNASMTHARVALETFAKDIAGSGGETKSLDMTKWGNVVRSLKESKRIGADEEGLLVGVFGLLSEGAHRPIGLTEREFTRLGISMATAMIYFLVKGVPRV